MGDIIHQSYHILIENGKKTLVSGCRKILEYSPERIKILLHREVITLVGSNLTLYDFFGDEIQISGKVGSLEISSVKISTKGRKGAYKMKKAGKSKHFGITDTILMLFFGYCEISVTSRKEDALNFLLSQKIKYNAMSNRPAGMSFRIYLYRKKMLTSYLREAGVEFSLGESRGLPALFMTLSKKYGFLLGATALLAITFLSESVIWEISVSGNESITDSEIRKEMSELGVRIGARISSLDFDSICTDYLVKNTDVSWIRVNIVGSSAEIVVREKKVAPSETEDFPSSLVALCDGYIFRVEVNSGQLLVNSGEAVLKGQVLVSGLVDNGNETFRFERSDARIFALTEESISVKIPMIYAKKRYTGENNVIADISIVMPSRTENFAVVTEILVGEYVIVGNVPDTFLQSDIFGKKLDL